PCSGISESSINLMGIPLLETVIPDSSNIPWSAFETEVANSPSLGSFIFSTDTAFLPHLTSDGNGINFTGACFNSSAVNFALNSVDCANSLSFPMESEKKNMQKNNNKYLIEMVLYN